MIQMKKVLVKEANIWMTLYGWLNSHCRMNKATGYTLLKNVNTPLPGTERIGCGFIISQLVCEQLPILPSASRLQLVRNVEIRQDVIISKSRLSTVPESRQQINIC